MIGGLSYAYAVEALVNDPGSLPGGLVPLGSTTGGGSRAWLCRCVCCSCRCRMAISHPGGGGPSPLRSWSGRCLGRSLSPRLRRFSLGTPTPIENPLARTGGSTIVILGIFGVILVIGGLVASLGAFIVRYRRSGGDERQRCGGSESRSASPCRWPLPARCCGVLFRAPRSDWAGVSPRAGGSPSPSSSTGSTRSVSSSTAPSSTGR